MPQTVTVIIPSYNRRHDLCRCIDSVLAQHFESIEILVVDDCSEDDTISFLKTNYTNVRVIASTRRFGPSHLRNLGIKAAKGDFLLFLDSDVVLPDENVLQRMVKIMSENPRIGELGGEIPVYRHIVDQAIGKKRDFFGKNHDVILKKCDRSGHRLKNCTYLATCNCMIHKSVALEVGGFDPYYRFGGEDADFGYRILNKGYCNQVCFGAGVHHYRSVVGRYSDETFRYHRTRVRFNLKHFSVLRNFLIATADLLNSVLFYFLLGPKIFFMKIKKIPIVRENYLGGWYLMKAYMENFVAYGELKRQKHTYFLCDEEMHKFEKRSSALS